MVNKHFGRLSVPIVGAAIGLVAYQALHLTSSNVISEQAIQRQLEMAQHESDPVMALSHLPHAPSNSKYFAQVQNVRETLSRQVFEKSQDLHRRGDVDAAIALLRSIPIGSSVSQESQSLRRTWISESINLQTARQALNQKHGEQALKALEPLHGSELFNSDRVQAMLREAVGLSTPNITVAQNLKSLPQLPPPAASVPKIVIPKTEPAPEIKAAITTTMRPISVAQMPSAVPVVAITPSSMVVPPPPPPVTVASSLPAGFSASAEPKTNQVESHTSGHSNGITAKTRSLPTVQQATVNANTVAISRPSSAQTKLPDVMQLPTKLPDVALSPTQRTLREAELPPMTRLNQTIAGAGIADSTKNPSTAPDFASDLLRSTTQSLAKLPKVEFKGNSALNANLPNLPTQPSNIANVAGVSRESNSVLNANTIQDMLNTELASVPNAD